MTRLLAAAALAAAAFLPAAADATPVPYCDNLPVMVACYTWSGDGVDYCHVWVAGRCVNLEDLVSG